MSHDELEWTADCPLIFLASLVSKGICSPKKIKPEAVPQDGLGHSHGVHIEKNEGC